MINIVITMAGVGQRFLAAGYQSPKYMIPVRGRTLFSWSVDSLRSLRPHGRYIFVALRAANSSSFIAQECARLDITRYEILELDQPTVGQATTAYVARRLCESAEPLVIYNIDTHVRPGVIDLPHSDFDGYVPCFRASGDHWSFVKVDEAWRATEVREKERVSDLATIGLYCFRTTDYFSELYQSFYGERQVHLEKGETYVAPMYNEIIRRGGTVSVSVIPGDAVYPLGTPDELMRFQEGDLGGIP